MRVPRLNARSVGLLLTALAAMLLVVLVAAQETSQPAAAHAALVRSNPSNNETLIRPPIRVSLFFTEGLERKLTKIEVFDAQNNRVDEDDIAFSDDDPAFASVGLPDLDPGLYFVNWSNVSTVDGHPYSGRYPFVILNPDGSLPAGVSLDNTATSGGTEALPKPIDAALKWIAMLSLSIVAGAAFFAAFVLRPAARFLEEEDEKRAVDAGDQWLVTLAHVLLPLSFVATTVLVLVTVSRLGTSTSVWSYVTTVRAGEYRAALLMLLVVALVGTDLLFLARGRALRTAGIWLLIAACAGGLFTYSMVSHGATAEGKFWSVLSDYAHFAASAVWLGALVMLPPLLRSRALGDDAGPKRFLLLANVFDRFSIAAGVSVAVIIASGVFNGLVEIPAWEALRETTYGRVLLVKLGIVAALLPVAGLNAFVLKPRLVQAVDETYGSDAKFAGNSESLAWLQRWLPRTIGVEIALVVAVFASVAVLTQTSTAKGEIAQEAAIRAASAAFNQSAEVEGLKLNLEVRPNLVGRNEYALAVQDADGAALESATQARLRFTYDSPDAVIPPAEFVLQAFEPGEFRGEGSFFSQPGNWRVEVRVRRSDGDDVSRLFVLPVLAQQRTATVNGDAYDLPFTSVSWNETVGVLLAFAGALVFVYRCQLGGLAAHARSVTMSAAAILLISGGILWFGVEGDHASTGDLQAGNPVKPTEESVSRGRMLFERNCVVCHGVDGRGDGEAAANLNPQPTDFRLHTPLHTDPEFYNFIANGYPGSAMPEFKNQFSPDDIWNLVNFLRAAFTDAPTE